MMRHMQPNGDTSSDTSTTGQATRHGLGQRHSIPDAAKVLALTAEAVRQRVKRGTLDSIKVDGKLFVLLDRDTSEDQSNSGSLPVSDTSYDRSIDTSNDTSRLVDALDDEVAHLRRQLDQANERDRENRRIIAGLVQRVPELEPASNAAPEPQERPETATEPHDKERVPGDQDRRSWWRKFFGIE